MTAIVLLPGMHGSGAFFQDLIDELHAPAIPISYPPDQPLGYAQLQQLVLPKLPRDEPFVLLGESFSGPVAIELASRKLPQLKALILACSFARYPHLPFRSQLRRLASALPVLGLPVSLTARLALGRFWSETLEAKLGAVMRTVSPATRKARVSEVITVDATAALRKLDLPVLYLRASEDRVVSSHAAEVVCSCAPNVKLMELEGPHLLLQAKPAEAAAAIDAFVNEHQLRLHG